MTGRTRRRPATIAAAAVSALALSVGTAHAATSGTVNGFSYGELGAGAPGATGCGTNVDGEPAIHVSRADNVFLGSERGVGSGSDLWRGLGSLGGPSAAACALEYRGQPNATSGVGPSGGDIDLAIASAPNAAGTYNVYVASLNLASISVARSSDNGTTFASTPVQGGVPVDDREWIAAYGAATSLLTYHDIASNNIDVLRSDNGGMTYTQTSTAIPATDYKASNNELGNIVIDHRNPSGSSFWAYQSFVAPSSSSGSAFNEAFLAVSSDGGHTWSDKPIPCSTQSGGDLDHNFPNVSVAPDGTLWYAWSNDHSVFTATSADHGATWTCSPAVSTNTAQAIFPWLVATSGGVDLAYYGAPTTGSGQTWSVYFAQNPTSTATGWGTPTQLMPVHSGAVCEGGISCTGGRQLLDDFGIDTDSQGWAHIAYSHDAPDLGGSGSFTGSAVQVGGTPAGAPNN
jgi:3D (Asp-Asp-Asp) domain-containing protein